MEEDVQAKEETKKVFPAHHHDHNHHAHFLVQDPVEGNIKLKTVLKIFLSCFAFVNTKLTNKEMLFHETISKKCRVNNFFQTRQSTGVEGIPM